MPRCERRRRGAALFELASAFAVSIAIATLALSASTLSLRQTRQLDRMAEGLELAANGLEQAVALLEQGVSIDEVRTTVAQRARASELPDVRVDIETMETQLAGDSAGGTAGGTSAPENTPGDGSGTATGSIPAVRVTIRVRWAGFPDGIWLTGFAMPVSEARG